MSCVLLLIVNFASEDRVVKSADTKITCASSGMFVTLEALLPSVRCAMEHCLAKCTSGTPSFVLSTKNSFEI